jgi:hypothetical protein
MTQSYILSFFAIPEKIRYFDKQLMFPRKERKKSLTRGHVEDIESAVGIQSCGGQGYEGIVSGKRIATSRDLHFYVMAVLSGALVVRAL